MIGKDINKAVDLLQAGQVVAIPTETVYGLAGNALRVETVSTIFAIKQRPAFDPLIIHTDDFSRFTAWVSEVPEAARRLAGRFLPGPLTLLLPKKPNIPDLVTAGSPLVAVRVPRHPMTLALLSRLDFPLAAPSANPFGYISPTSAAHVAAQLGDKIPYILDGGPCEVGVESTIIGFAGDQPTVLRKGGISIEAIEACIGPVKIATHSASNPQAPGMLKSHYAPRVRLILGKLDQLLAEYQDRNIGVISFQQYASTIPADRQIVLSEKGDLTEAARNFFAGLRYLDSLDLDLIIAELLPEKGLGRAINDRLRRAAVVGE